jgi:RimJ/RimL family protein N-acetyltransferase
MATKEEMHRALPLLQGDLTIREWTRQDVDLLASWPAYPFPYEGFEFSFAQMDSIARDEVFQARQENPNAIVLVVDHPRQPAIAYLALRSIDWREGRVGNLGFRVHPAWCDRGLGTSVLRRVTRWSLEQGIVLWRLDVAASNTRAVRCYERVGFVTAGRIRRQASDLCEVDLDRPRYDFIRPYVRGRDAKIELAFLVMELGSEDCRGR